MILKRTFTLTEINKTLRWSRCKTAVATRAWLLGWWMVFGKAQERQERVWEGVMVFSLNFSVFCAFFSAEENITLEWISLEKKEKKTIMFYPEYFVKERVLFKKWLLPQAPFLWTESRALSMMCIYIKPLHCWLSWVSVKLSHLLAFFFSSF